MGSRAGIKQIGFCDAGTLLTSPTGSEVIGLRNEAKLIIEPFKTVKDYRERELPNMQNFKLEAESLQFRMKQLKAMIGFVNLNADVQIQTQPQSFPGYDVFQFAGVNKLGLGFEYMITAEKRSCKVMLEGAMEEDKAVTFIDAADSTVLEDLGFTGEGADFTSYKAPYFLAFEFPKATAIISSDDIIERKLTIKTKGKKDIYNRDIVDYLTVELEITGRNAAISDVITMFNKTLGASVVIKEKNGASTFDGFDFATGVLTKTQTLSIDDTERTMKVKFIGDVPIYDITWDLAVTGGGDVAADGVVGGTMKVGY
jgi:hypothetical protein